MMTYIKMHPIKGRCVHSAHRFSAGRMIEKNPVITFPFLPEGYPLLEYAMQWSDTEDCIALGNINLINHSENPNCSVENYIAGQAKLLHAERDILQDEELTIKYKRKLWFEPVEGLPLTDEQLFR